jgi:hypothetical protein
MNRSRDEGALRWRGWRRCRASTLMSATDSHVGRFWRLRWLDQAVRSSVMMRLSLVAVAAPSATAVVRAAAARRR